MRLELFSYQAGSGFSRSSAAPVSRPSFVLVFGATSLEHDTAFWSQLGAMFPGVPIAGCSTAGTVGSSGSSRR